MIKREFSHVEIALLILTCLQSWYTFAGHGALDLSIYPHVVEVPLALQTTQLPKRVLTQLLGWQYNSQH